MAATDTQIKNAPQPLDLRTTPKTSSFQALEAAKSTETSQVLKASEGSRLTEPFRVAGALAGSVIRAAYSVYDNARTDLRVANAAKEMQKFNPEQIPTVASATSILGTWLEMANNNARVGAQMKALGGVAAIIVDAHKEELVTLRSDITSSLERPLKDGVKLKDCVGVDGANIIKSLATEEKKAFVEAYNELRGRLTDLNSLSKKVEDQARAFYESSVERFKAQSDFKPEKSVSRFYNSELKTLDSNHSKELGALAGEDPTPDQIRAVGEKFTQELKELQDRTTALSSSLKSAAEVESKVEQTLKYLKEETPAVGVSDKSVVFVGAQAADKIADWVEAQTKEAKELLAKAKEAKDPAAIAEATERLTAASDVVHKQLDDVAALLSKINAGRAQDGTDTAGVRERIIAKASEHNVGQATFSQPLSEYISALSAKMDSVVAEMFKDPASQSVGTGELKKFVAQHHDRVEHLITREASDRLTTEEVAKALKLAEDSLREKAPPVKDKVDAAAEEYDRRIAQRVAELEKQPKQSFFSRLRSWFVNN
jgi:hypothetical protein